MEKINSEHKNSENINTNTNIEVNNESSNSNKTINTDTQSSTIQSTSSNILNNSPDLIFCKGCNFIFKNIKEITQNNEFCENLKDRTDSSILYEENEIMSCNKDLNISSTISSASRCKFCIGILDPKNFKFIYERIKEQINEYDHKDYKITTNFSPLFALVHAYVRNAN